MQTDERWEDDDLPRPGPYVDGAWGRTANPNTLDGQLQNLAAFGAGLTRLQGGRRTAAKVVVWMILLGTVLAILATAVASLRAW